MSYVSNTGTFNITKLAADINALTNFEAQEKNWQQNYPDRETFVVARLALIAELKRQSLLELGLWKQAADDVAADLTKRGNTLAKADGIAGALSVIGAPGIILGLGISLATMIFKRDLKSDLAFEQERFATAVKPYEQGIANLIPWENRYLEELNQIRLVKTGTYAVAGYIAYQLFT